MKPMYKPKPQLFPGWLCTALVVLGLLLMMVATMSGCASLDKVAEDGQRLGNDPLVRSTAEAIPYGGLVLAGINGALALYLGIRKRQWKTAFETVVNTVEPYIPADEAKRAELKAAQGKDVTAMVKSVRG